MIVSTGRSVQAVVEGTDATDLVRSGGGLKAIGLVGGEHGPLDDKTAPLHEFVFLEHPGYSGCGEYSTGTASTLYSSNQWLDHTEE